MTAFTDQLGRVSLTINSPDRNIEGRFGFESGLAFTVHDPRRFDSYDETTLATQVREVLRGMLAGREQAIRAAFDQAGRTVREPGSHPDAHRRRYRDELAELVAAGASDNGRLTIAARGTAQLTVTIAPGALREWDAASFEADLLGAYRDFTRHRNALRRDLKREYFH